jgi:hypothetical protein
MAHQHTRTCNLLVLVSLLVGFACLSTLLCAGSELKKETIAAFDEYVKATEGRMAEELRPGGKAFLYPNGLPTQDRVAIYEQLRRDQIFITRLETTIHGKHIAVPKGLLHHWVGVAFIPRTNMRDVRLVALDYDNRAVVYKPEVIASKLLWHQENDYKVFLRLFQKKFTTVILNTEYTIHWSEIDAKHLYSASYSTKIAEVKDPGNPNGAELPVGNDHGYLWRLYSYWRFAEEDGGVYMQCEVISLTRDIPFGLGWLIRPLITSIPKQSLDRVLAQTRAAVVHEHTAASRSLLLRQHEIVAEEWQLRSKNRSRGATQVRKEIDHSHGASACCGQPAADPS